MKTKIEKTIAVAKTNQKPVLNYNRLYKTGVSQHIGQIRFTKDGMKTEWKDGITTKSLTRPGYYFLMKNTEVVARYFVASTKGIDGFNSVLRNLRKCRTSVDKQIAYEKRVQVYFVAADDVPSMFEGLKQDVMMGEKYAKHTLDSANGQAYTLNNHWIGATFKIKHQVR